MREECRICVIGADEEEKCCIESWKEMHPHRRYTVRDQAATRNGQGAKLAAGVCIAAALLAAGFFVGSFTSTNAINQAAECMEGCK